MHQRLSVGIEVERMLNGKKVVEDKDLTIQKLREELAKARQTDNDKPRWVEVDNV